jgi:hypothetical protein
MSVVERSSHHASIFRQLTGAPCQARLDETGSDEEERCVMAHSMETHVHRRVLPAALLAVGLAAVALVAPTVGHAVGPSTALLWSPTTSAGTYGYGTVTVGQSVAKTFTLTSASGRLSGLAISLSGSAFTKTADTCTGKNVDPKDPCSVTVEYSPSAADANDTGTLTATSRIPKASASITLTGAGAAAKSQSQIDCESFGGTFAVGTDPVLWTCQWANTGQADYGPKNNTLIDDCFALLNQFPGSGGYEYNSGSEPVIPGANTGKCFHF